MHMRMHTGRVDPGYGIAYSRKEERACALVTGRAC